MINKTNPPIQKCKSCDIILQSIGTQYICYNCNYQAVQFQQQLRVVPEKYQSNCKQKRQIQSERKLNLLIRQFTDKYRDISDSQQMKYLREKILMIKREMPKKKGIREIAGVVSYFHMIEDVKMNTKEYCRSNNLNLKIFNQKYKIYHKIFKNILFHSLDDNKELKVQQKIEQSNTTEKSIDQNISEDFELEDLPPCLDIVQDQQIQYNFKHGLNIIFDDIFCNYFYRQKKEMIVNKLINQIKKISKDFFNHIRYSQNAPLKIYYLIFGLIKTLGYKISYFNYSEIVKTKTGFLLKRKMASQIKKYYQRYNNYNQIKMEETDNL